MDLLVAKFLAALLLPPVNILLPLLLAFRWRSRRPSWALAALLLGSGLLLIQSMPLVADGLCRVVEEYPALSIDEVKASDAGAIVVLAGGWRRAQEYGRTTINGRTLERLAYGVWLHRQTGLPLAVSGGRVFGSEEVAEGALMEQALIEQFDLRPRWVEAESRNTAENAINTAVMLKASGVGRILLVTQAFHMARALAAFEKQGLRVLAAPTGFLAGPEYRFSAGRLVPDVTAMQRSYLALHELMGTAWYRLRY